MDPSTEHRLQTQAGRLANKLDSRDLERMSRNPQFSEQQHDLIQRAIACKELRLLESSMALTEAMGRISGDIGL